MSGATPPDVGEGDEPTLPPKVRNRRIKCHGRTVIRHEEDVRDENGQILHRRGDPKLDEDYARQYRPCQGWAANGTNYCAAHGGSTPAAIAAAKRSITLSAPSAAEILARIANDERVAPETRVKAATQLLDRGGIRAGVDVGLETPGWQSVLGKMFGSPDPDANETEPPSERDTRDDDAADPTGIIRERVRKLTAPKAAPAAEPAPAAPPRKATRRKATPPPQSDKPKFEGW